MRKVKGVRGLVGGRWLWNLLVFALVVVACVGVGPRYETYSEAGRIGTEGVAMVTQVSDDEPVVNPNSAWEVALAERVSACDNRPGLKKIYVTVLDEVGVPLRGIRVRFDTEPSEGVAFDHMNVWGFTNEWGYIEWDHLGKPTRYRVWMEDEETPLIWNIRTDLGNEYCKPPGAPSWSGNVPVNRPGIYSYRLEIRKEG